MKFTSTRLEIYAEAVWASLRFPEAEASFKLDWPAIHIIFRADSERFEPVIRKALEEATLHDGIRELLNAQFKYGGPYA